MCPLAYVGYRVVVVVVLINEVLLIRYSTMYHCPAQLAAGEAGRWRNIFTHDTQLEFVPIPSQELY